MSKKRTADWFKESESGLRDVSFGEDVPTGSQKRRLYYVLLVALPAGVYTATGAGAWYKATHPASQVLVFAVQALSFMCTTLQSLPEVCVPTPRADVGPWTPGIAGTTGYLSMDATQASFEQSMIGMTAYIQGRDDYPFLFDIFNVNFSQALGRVRPIPKQVSAWNHYVSGIEIVASEQGATALLIPTSVTWGIYSDEPPQWTDPLMGTTPLNLICSTLLARTRVDVREGLHEAREGSEAPLYSMTNPHQSPYAVYVVWNQTLSYLAVMNPRFEGLPSLTPSDVGSVDAPSEYEALGTPAQSGPRAVPIYEQDPGSVHLLQLETHDDLADTTARLVEVTNAPEVSLANPVDFQNKPALIYNPNRCDTTLIVCDSQGNNPGPEVVATFKYTIQVGHSLDTEQSTGVAVPIEAYRPSVVIVEFTLRYLVLAPAASK